VCDVQCCSVDVVDMSTLVMAVDVLQFRSTWFCVGRLLGLSVQRSAWLIWRGVYSTAKGLRHNAKNFKVILVFATSDYLLTTHVSETFHFVILCFGKILL